jgi:1,4-alpha-glucan branching enzyme
MIPREEIDRIAAVDHADPHSALGPHEEGGATVVRTFRPDALGVTVLRDGKAPTPMQRVHSLGIFEASFPAAEKAEGPRLLRYRLEVEHASDKHVTEDAYAFAPGLGDLDLHLAAEGTHLEIYHRLGAHVREIDGVRGTSFAVWAPAAQRVSVTGDFTNWDGRLYAMRRMGHGIWEIFVPGVVEGAIYKYEIKTLQGPLVLKCDPYGQAMELRPKNASRVVTRRYEFTDAAWIAERSAAEARRRPMSVYEVHLGSWRIKPLEEPAPGAPPSKGDPAERWYNYREIADQLVDYVVEMGFTHVELLPIMEHPFDGSWGYQVSGYFAPTSRYGSPDDFRYFVDRFHSRGVGVLLDWTPAHFPKDAFALGRFDGSALYEHLDPRKGEHKHWNTYVFNYGRPEVKNFLIGNALYWMEEFHIDGLRVDAVASMLYLDYGAAGPSDWVPNKHGGRENLEAIDFLRELNERVHERFPGALMIAEESTAWPGVTKPSYVGGLGFDAKWNMGWMHDTLGYFGFDPIHRAFHHGKLTFSIWYAWSERFLLPLSHDEVVHLKKSLLSKMPGDRWKMHANLRALYAYMWAHPGKKLLFMGGEIGQWKEWAFAGELEWQLLEEADHRGLSQLVRDLNRLYRAHPAMYEMDDEVEGFKWIDCNDAPNSVIAFLRFPSFVSGRNRRAKMLTKGVHVAVVCNLTPLPRRHYRVGVPRRCAYLEVLNTDAEIYGGSGLGNLGRVQVEEVPQHGFPQSLVLTLPPLSVLWLVPELDEDPRPDSVRGEGEEGLLLQDDARAGALMAAGLSAAAVASLAATPIRALENESTLVSVDAARRSSS